jgi:hypothetical protein
MEMVVSPTPIQGNPFGWRCPKCRVRLPDATKPVAIRLLNDKHLSRCISAKKEANDGL